MNSNCNNQEHNPIFKIEIPVYSRDDFFSLRYTLNQIVIKADKRDEITLENLFLMIDSIDTAELYFINEINPDGSVNVK